MPGVRAVPLDSGSVIVALAVLGANAVVSAGRFLALRAVMYQHHLDTSGHVWSRLDQAVTYQALAPLDGAVPAPPPSRVTPELPISPGTRTPPKTGAMRD